MSTALDRIITYKREDVAAIKRVSSFSELDAKARAHPAPRGFADALSSAVEQGRNGLICELKRKSPSAGEILPGANPIEIARQYEAGGAACLSILTDGPSFGGSLADLEAVRTAIGLPVLRKDFMIDTLQIAEARAHGADAILIIMAAVDDDLAADLCDAAADYAMDVLVEAHNAEELERALALPAELFGINNRDLTRMVTDLAVTEDLAPLLPPGRTLVSESGVKTPSDIQRLRATGARRFLIGESLMKEQDRQRAVTALCDAR